MHQPIVCQSSTIDNQRVFITSEEQLPPDESYSTWAFKDTFLDADTYRNNLKNWTMENHNEQEK